MNDRVARNTLLKKVGHGPDYSALLRSIWHLNRVHNGDDTELAVQLAKRFCDENLIGAATIHWYRPGESFNHWIVPQRWNLRRYRLIGPDGSLIATEADHTLAVSPYSSAVDVELNLDELKRYIVTRSDLPDSYSFFFRRMYRPWEAGWNISLPYKVVVRLRQGRYRVRIDAEFSDAPMPVFEYFLRGRTDKTIFLAGHVDHPGMINDSLSGCLASLQAVESLERSGLRTEYSYRVWWVPEIIGSAVHLKANEHLLEHAFFSICPNMTSHDAPLAMCLSKAQTSLIDLALLQALRESRQEFVVGPFHKFPDCGDAISFDAIGYGIPTPTLSRIGDLYSNYHSSHDDLESFLQPDSWKRHTQLVSVLCAALRYIEDNQAISTNFRGNPCLSSPGVDLYLGSSNINNEHIAEHLIRDLDGNEVDLRNFMEFYLDALGRDGVSVLEIANAAKLPVQFVRDYTARFAEKGLVSLKPVSRNMAFEKIASVSPLQSMVQVEINRQRGTTDQMSAKATIR